MPDILNVIEAASKSDEFLENAITLHQGRLLVAIESLQDNIINDLSQLQTTLGGRLVGPKVNLKQTQQLHKKLVREFESQFNIEVDSILGDFSEISNQIENSYKSLGEAAKFTNVDKVMMDTLRGQTYKQYVQFGEMARDDIANAMYTHVLGGGKFSTLLNTVTGVLTGHKDARGRPMTQYAKQFANDSVMNYHNQVNVSKGEALGLKHFLYYGDIISTSRDFCIKRVGKVYTKRQIGVWDKMSWAGKAGPAFENRGGYNCRHHWRPVRKEWMLDDLGLEIPRGEKVAYMVAEEGNKYAKQLVTQLGIAQHKKAVASSKLWNKNKKLSGLANKNTSEAKKLKKVIQEQKDIIESSKFEIKKIKFY